MRYITTILLLTLTICSSGQHLSDSLKISKQTKDIVSKIAAVNELDGSAVGEAGRRPKQYDNFIELQKKATIAELKELTNHPNGAVRCYALWALSCDSTVSLLPIIVRHLNDTTLVRTQFGCIGGRKKVGDFFVNVTQFIDVDSKQLTPAEHEYLDSVLVYTPNMLNSRDWAIERLKLTEASYNKVRELVMKESNQSALIVLAKFRRKQDIPIILNNRLTEQDGGLFHTYRAICEFPDPAFRPLLRESLQDVLNKSAFSSGWSYLYDAIACFKDDTAYQLLKTPFIGLKDQDLRTYHMDFLFNAVREYYSPIYDDLLWEMWENEKKITPDVFTLLYQRHPQRAFQLTKKTIQNADDFYYLSDVDETGDGKNPINLIDIMLDTVLANDRPLALELINKNIRDVNVHVFGTFADKALKLRDESCIRALLTRLEKEDNPNVYLKAAKVLVTFNSKEINRQIASAPERNANLKTGWGGESYARLLKENGISH